MKQIYVKPETMVTELELEAMLAISEGGNINVSNNRGDELSTGRNSDRVWGNLWVGRY